MFSVRPSISAISYKPLVRMSPNYNLDALVDKDELVKF